MKLTDKEKRLIKMAAKEGMTMFVLRDDETANESIIVMKECGLQLQEIKDGLTMLLGGPL